MKNAFFSGLLFTLLLGISPAQSKACTLLSSEAILTVFEKAPQLEQRSKLPTRCDYSWAREDQTQVEQKNRAALKQGASTPYIPAPLWQKVVLERYQVTDSKVSALQALTKLVDQGPAPKFGSPDPLKNIPFKKLGPDSAWSETQNVMLFVKGKSLYRLHLQLSDLEPSKIQSKATALREAMTAP